ncbi:DUF523 domain-containing protein [Clostridium sp. BJN0001]|uniref:DUF523 domain-containing protein n=1 Tax=Clostridium sp. BJN0001 TaxID=2930219 RepID=UPI001FD2D0A7|nr:DUF523 domain-containing protein [Clostridium sp. BJN0001]
MFLISACLCGVNCKYSGKNNKNDMCVHLLKEGKALIICPEQLGGLKTPRKPSELQNAADEILDDSGKIITCDGDDVTQNYLKGAEETLKIAEKAGIKKAILKEGSPSCGVNYVYDGTFTHKKIKGCGLTASILKKNGIDVLSEQDFEEDKKLVYLDKFDKNKAKLIKSFKMDEQEQRCETEFDLSSNLVSDDMLPETVRNNVKRLMVSLARDMLGFESVDEIVEATGFSKEEVEKIINEDGEDKK